MKKIKIFIFFVGLLLIYSCAKYDRNNPYDVVKTIHSGTPGKKQFYCVANVEFGIINLNGTTEVDSGTSICYTFNPNPGYRLKSIIVDNINCTIVDSNTYTILMDTNHSIKVIFELDTKIDTGIKYGLVAFFPFNNNTNDESGNNYKGVNYGAISCNDRHGNVNSAYQFVNTQKIVTNYTGITGKADRTISLWFNSSCCSDAVPIFFYGGSLGGATQIYLSSDNRIIIDASNSTVTYENKVAYNTWHNVALTYTSSYGNNVLSFKIYLDGELLTNIYDKYNESQLLNNSDGSIGYVTFGGIWSYSMASVKIDDIYIYNRVLSQTEIKELYSN